MECEPLTVRRYAILTACGSPLVNGGSIGPEHVAQFLWVLSPEFDPRNETARDTFAERCAGLDYTEAVDELKAFCEGVFLDTPPLDLGRKEEPNVSWMASLTHTFAKSYGWTVDMVLDTEMAIVFQLLKMLDKDANPNSANWNRLTDQVRDAYLCALNAPKQ